MILFAERIGSSVVAEGIEREEELLTLRALGVPYGQGYYLARPAPLPLEPGEVPRRVAETRSTYRFSPDVVAEHLPLDDLLVTLQEMEAEMKRASKALEFERAAEIRDEIQRLKRLLPDQDMLPGKKAAIRSRQ